MKTRIGPSNETLLYFFAVISSILLSLWVMYHDTVVNPDGICYLLSAQIVGTSAMKDVMQFCPQSQWPFYSALIYGIVKLTHFSYPVSAYVLNGFFSVLSVITFILIIKELNAPSRVLWLSAFVILFDHQFNVLRESIIRDHGFWAFYLGSIFFLLRFFERPHWLTAFAWNACLLIATLFRIEGAIFLLALPFVIWLTSWSFKERASAFIKLILPTVCICLMIIVWHGLYSQSSSLDKLGRVGEIINQFHHGFMIMADRYHTTYTALVQYVLPIEATTDATVVLFLVWISWYLYNVAITLSLVYVALVLYAWKTKAAKWGGPSTLVICAYAVVSLMVTLTFLAEHLFISKRYLVALTLVLMLWVPFALNDLIQKWSSHKHRWFLSLIALVFFISALSGIVEFGQSKFYIRSGGDWVAKNVPANASVYSNDFQLMYYTQHFGKQIFALVPSYLNIHTIAEGRWKQYDYLVLRLKNKEEGETAAVLQELASISPVQIFTNKRGNHVAIYKIK